MLLEQLGGMILFHFSKGNRRNLGENQDPGEFSDCCWAIGLRSNVDRFCGPPSEHQISSPRNRFVNFVLALARPFSIRCGVRSPPVGYWHRRFRESAHAAGPGSGQAETWRQHRLRPTRSHLGPGAPPPVRGGGEEWPSTANCEPPSGRASSRRRPRTAALCRPVSLPPSSRWRLRSDERQSAVRSSRTAYSRSGGDGFLSQLNCLNEQRFREYHRNNLNGYLNFKKENGYIIICGNCGKESKSLIEKCQKCGEVDQITAKCVNVGGAP